ncbi:MAG: anthranilate phosphoribosyltransferase [Desulfobacterales bacterium SG8_35_2]|jgi:anthranilate phosphoribosyltransferase|nr:MAG: anthranilate phosphoribosyltransferase [Desulfobacterales bacterium SG8_35_2]
MIREAISRVIERKDLDEELMVGVMDEIMSGEATPAQIGSFITALRMKGETIEEISGAAMVMRRKATRIATGVAVDKGEILVDTCGTGGDSSGTFNVSTATAFVVAAAGIPVAKHGNRSISSHCGSADVLEALGVNLDLTPEQVGNCVREVGIGFLFAPMLHGAMKYAIGPRREIGIRTIFNVLGPLTNPAGANVQLLGVYSPDLCEKLARVLGRLGSLRALVVCGAGNVDELTVTGDTEVAELANNEVKTYTVRPEDAGVSRAEIADLKGGATPEESAAILRDVLAGAAGPKRSMLLLNSGAALYAAGMAPAIKAGVKLAAELIDSGAALARLDGLIQFTQNVS